MATNAVRNIVLEILKKRGEIRTQEVVRKTGFTRAYVQRFLHEMTADGELVRLGNTNQARYLDARSPRLAEVRKSRLAYRARLRNEGLEEDRVLAAIRRETGILDELRTNVSRIVDYAFMEMLNNAIDHSRAPTIDVRMRRTESVISFSVVDPGIGIFRNIMRQLNLDSEADAALELVKGKRTTMPSRHSGEGIFFTSKAADRLAIGSAGRTLIFDSLVPDVFVRSSKSRQGTAVDFRIALDSRRELDAIFREFTSEDLRFDRTRVMVKLASAPERYVSRSQARRLMSGLERFREVELDFAGVAMAGQGFVDEVFRVWAGSHPDTRIKAVNASPDVAFMLSRERE